MIYYIKYLFSKRKLYKYLIVNNTDFYPFLLGDKGRFVIVGVVIWVKI